MLPTLRRQNRSIGPFEELQREIDSALGRAWTAGDGDDGGTGVYPVDIRETEDSFVVDAELPGFKREEIVVTLEQGVLTIRAERKAAAEAEKGSPQLRERRFTRVVRSFALGQAFDESKVHAKLEDGVLRLTLPKREDATPKRIAIT